MQPQSRSTRETSEISSSDVDLHRFIDRCLGVDQQYCSEHCTCSAAAMSADIAVGDEMIADSYEMKEVEDGFFFEVEGSVSSATFVEHMPFQDNTNNQQGF